eukprot:Hpha_TRINITY_DN14765_c0_g1::TRINITY_DN14765_c0_g1_i1::g.102921::m.102921
MVGKATYTDPLCQSPTREGTTGGFRTVTFKVPLAHRTKTLSFKIGATVAEEDGCVKVKDAEDEYGNQFFMKLILMHNLESIPGTIEVRDRINTEIGVLKILDHRHIVKLFQVFSSADIVYVLMEKVTTPLSAIIQSAGGKLPEARAKKYFHQILEAISYLHGRGLVHRDLCLDHIYIDDSADMVKVTSFELSCLQSSRDLLSDHPGVDPLYAAPELLGSEPYHGKKADIWSMGCLLHTMLTGSPPYTDKDKKPGDPKQLPMTGISPQIRSLIEKTLQLDWKMGRINLNDLLRDPWVTDGETPVPLAAESFVGVPGAAKASLASIEAELEASTSRELQASFAKLEGLNLSSAGVSGVTPLKERPDPLTSPADSQDVVDETFSPLRKERRRPFALIDTPLGAHKEIEPLWAADDGDGGGGQFHIEPPPMLELSPRAGISSPSARTRRTLNFDILAGQQDLPTLGSPPQLSGVAPLQPAQG